MGKEGCENISTALRSCPFCNEEAHIHYMIGLGRWVVICRDCKASTRDCSDRNEAIEAWNKRDMPPSVVEGLEKLADRIVGVADCCEDCPAYPCGLGKSDQTKCKNAITKTLARAAGWEV